jgi:hypothetical protein
MKTALIIIASLTLPALVAQAQTTTVEKNAPNVEKSAPEPDQLRRLDSVSWDLKSHTLRWTVQKGTEVDGKFIPSGKSGTRLRPMRPS